MFSIARFLCIRFHNVEGWLHFSLSWMNDLFITKIAKSSYGVFNNQFSSIITLLKKKHWLLWCVPHYASYGAHTKSPYGSEVRDENWQWVIVLASCANKCKLKGISVFAKVAKFCWKTKFFTKASCRKFATKTNKKFSLIYKIQLSLVPICGNFINR